MMIIANRRIIVANIQDIVANRWMMTASRRLLYCTVMYCTGAAAGVPCGQPVGGGRAGLGVPLGPGPQLLPAQAGRQRRILTWILILIILIIGILHRDMEPGGGGG